VDSRYSSLSTGPASSPQIGSGEVDDLVAASVEDGFQHVEGETLGHFDGYLGRHGKLHPIDDGVDQHRARMRQRFGELALDLGRILDADALDTDCLSHGREVRVDKFRTGIKEPSRLLLQLDEAERPVVALRLSISAASFASSKGDRMLRVFRQPVDREVAEAASRITNAGDREMACRWTSIDKRLEGQPPQRRFD
jgi:hypothetical protein